MKLSTKLLGGFGIIVLLVGGLTAYNQVELGVLRTMQDEGAQRGRDAIRVEEAGSMGARMYQIVADAEINRDMAESQRRWEEIKKESDDDLATCGKIADSDLEKAAMGKTMIAYHEFVRLVEQELFPELKKTKDMTEQIRTLDSKIDTPVTAMHDELGKVEAARAGEAGKGFAVVAEEVRNLARRSAEAAKTTSDLIEGAQKNADAGVNVSTEVAKSLSGIQTSAGKVAALIAEIAAAAKEQSQGIEQVNTAVSEMDKVVQQNAAGAEESASAAEELSSQAEELGSMVQQLIALVSGNTGNHRSHERHVGGGYGAAPHPTATHRPAATRATAVARPAHADPMRSAAHKALPAAHAKAPSAAAQDATKPARQEEVIPLDDNELKQF